MKQVYKCEFCYETFDCAEEALQHEKICSHNPENEITDKTATRLAMLMYEFPRIVATALARLCEEKIPFLRQQSIKPLEVRKHNCCVLSQCFLMQF